MKKLPLTTAIVLAVGNAAFAADLPSRKEPVYLPPPPILWTGFYGGLNLGGTWSTSSDENGLLPYVNPALPIGAANFFLLPGGGQTSNTPGGVVGGGQLGYNYQFGTSVVVGVEADFQGTSIGRGNQRNNVAIVPGGALIPLAGNNGSVLGQWFGTARGRVGYLVTPTLLIYGTGGFAYGNAIAFGGTNTLTGWTAGGGAEWMFLPNWSAKIEYLYTNLSSGGVTGGGFNFGSSYRYPQFNVVRAGVNYHFNWGALAPVVAKF